MQIPCENDLVPLLTTNDNKWLFPSGVCMRPRYNLLSFCWTGDLIALGSQPESK